MDRSLARFLEAAFELADVLMTRFEIPLAMFIRSLPFLLWFLWKGAPFLLWVYVVYYYDAFNQVYQALSRI